MDPQVQASFIPKRSLDVSANNRGGFGGLLFLISLLIFVASIVSAGGVFAYKQYLQNAITQKAGQLKLAEGAYDPGAIQDLVTMDNRLAQAKILLGKHVAVSGLFAFLSTQTLQSVSFNDFNYTFGDHGSAKITMQGTADSFSSVALQSDQFNNNKLLSNVVFSGITADQTGRVAFSVSANVDPSVISYAATLQNSTTINGAPVTAPTASTTTQ